MLTDSGNLLSEAQAVTASAISTYVYDTHSASIGGLTRDISGQDCPIWLNFTITESFATATSVTFSLESDDNTSLSSATVHYTSAAIAIATLVAGYSFSVQVPPGQYQRYVGARYTIGGSSATAGKITALLTDGVPLHNAYQNNWVN
jgi:hypothetical protein